MTIVGWSQIVFFSLILLACTKPLGLYMHKVMEEQPSLGCKFIQPVEKFIYKLCGVTPEYEMRWTEYAFCAIAVSAASSLFTYAILRLQGFLPLNPVHFSTASAPSWATNMTPDLAFNTAVSFATNTNWQAYSGENTMSYLSQMLGLAFHNWLWPLQALPLRSLWCAVSAVIALKPSAIFGKTWCVFTFIFSFRSVPSALFSRFSRMYPDPAELLRGDDH